VKVSVVVPARNEERHLGACLDSILTGLAAVGEGEVLVIDGRSTDGTARVVADYASRFPSIRLVPNPRRITAAAFNIGIQAAASARIAIVGAHSTVEPDFFVAALRALDAGEADIVGGPVRTEPDRAGLIAWLLARVVSHPFGVGNSGFRVSNSRRYVDAVPFAVFRREVFEVAGGFDETLGRNQDTEFFGRVGAAGFRVLLDPAVRSVYRARGTVSGLMSQGFLNAYWNMLVWRRTPRSFRWRHAAPAAFTATLFALAVLAPVTATARILLVVALGLYLLAASVSALQIARRTGRVAPLALPPLFFAYHFTYGLGSIAGLHWLLAPRADTARG
jgi:glycosyltransferase involved in cell wall biosynthesis